jgi:hypothetical protein
VVYLSSWFTAVSAFVIEQFKSFQQLRVRVRDVSDSLFQGSAFYGASSHRQTPSWSVFPLLIVVASVIGIVLTPFFLLPAESFSILFAILPSAGTDLFFIFVSILSVVLSQVFFVIFSPSLGFLESLFPVLLSGFLLTGFEGRCFSVFSHLDELSVPMTSIVSTSYRSTLFGVLFSSVLCMQRLTFNALSCRRVAQALVGAFVSVTSFTEWSKYMSSHGYIVAEDNLIYAGGAA